MRPLSPLLRRRTRPLENTPLLLTTAPPLWSLAQYLVLKTLKSAVASGKLDPVASLRDAHARTAPEMRRVIAEHAQYPDRARTPD